MAKELSKTAVLKKRALCCGMEAEADVPGDCGCRGGSGRLLCRVVFPVAGETSPLPVPGRRGR